jgi:serralysin
MDGNAKGGSDTLTETTGGYGVLATLYGDAYTMSGNTRGGNDTLTATLSGRGVRASLYGDAETSDNARGGDDILTTGYVHSYSLYGDADTMTDNTRGGNDTLTANVSVLVGGGASLYGDAYTMSDNTRGGNDTLTATVGIRIGDPGRFAEASLYGDAETMSNNARGGDDTLTLIASEDYTRLHGALYGDAGTMSGSAVGGNDILNGSASNDTLYGDAANYNPSSPGSIKGGKDILNGGAGNDQLWGGPNDDAFVFGRGSGNDTINDFNQGNAAVGSPAKEHDVIDVRAYGFADWNALRGLISDNSSGNAVIQLSPTDSITLVGVHSASLKASDFIISGPAPKVI